MCVAVDGKAWHDAGRLPTNNSAHSRAHDVHQTRVGSRLCRCNGRLRHGLHVLSHRTHSLMSLILLFTRRRAKFTGLDVQNIPQKTTLRFDAGTLHNSD